MNLIWAFEIKKVDGDDSLDPENPAFVDAAIRYVRILFPTMIDFNLLSPLAPRSLLTVFSGTDVD